MTPGQIARLMATEHRITDDPRRSYWHYQRARATAYRDAVWQRANRADDRGWETIDTPGMEILLRLEHRGAMQDGGLRWQGFHDPSEYDRGF